MRRMQCWRANSRHLTPTKKAYYFLSNVAKDIPGQAFKPLNDQHGSQPEDIKHERHFRETIQHPKAIRESLPETRRQEVGIA